MTDPTTKPLSPAAQAVLDAFWKQPGDRSAIAATLRAVADQVVPDGPQPSADSDYHLMCWSKVLDQHAQRQQTRAEILALAVELEGSHAHG